MKIYSIQDQAAEYFLPIFLAENDKVAQRMMIQSMGDQFQHRHDYVLWSLGKFDRDEGTIEATVPKMVLHGKSIPDNTPEDMSQFIEEGKYK